MNLIIKYDRDPHIANTAIAIRGVVQQELMISFWNMGRPECHTTLSPKHIFSKIERSLLYCSEYLSFKNLRRRRLHLAYRPATKVQSMWEKRQREIWPMSVDQRDPGQIVLWNSMALHLNGKDHRLRAFEVSNHEALKECMKASGQTVAMTVAAIVFIFRSQETSIFRTLTRTLEHKGRNGKRLRNLRMRQAQWKPGSLSRVKSRVSASRSRSSRI